MEKIKCALCGSESYSIVLTVVGDRRFSTTDRRFNLVRCQRCGLVYVEPKPRKEELDELYPRIYYGSRGQIERFVVKLIYNIKILKIMNFKRNGRILDVGCGDGEFLLRLKERGWNVYGVDTSGIAYKLARRKLGKSVYNRELKDCRFPDEYFDIVTLNHVLEHISKPYDVLREIDRILKDKGILVLSTPNIHSFQFKISGQKWFHLDVPRHSCFYDPNTVATLLKNTGFKIISITYPLFEFPLDLYYSLARKWFNGHPSIVWIFCLPLLLASILIKILPGFRGTFEVIAQKSL